MARVFYLGAPSRVLLPPNASLARAISTSGGNTGNLLIGHAIRRQLKPENLADRFDLGPQYIARNFDRIVLGASNFLHRNFDFGFWADFLEKVKLPCTIIGLGAQAPEYGCAVEVPAGTQRLIKLISQSSTTLGVRGHWTASVLSGLGIHNVRVIGCPAMFWSCKPSLHIKQSTSRRPLRIAINGAAEGVEHASQPAAARAVESQLTRLSLEHKYPYILQNALELAELAAGLPPKNPDIVPRLMEQYGLSDLSADAFAAFARENTRIYFKVAQWHEALREFDFVVGSRFHGCLLALFAGVPSFIFAHDARTRELCELLNLPHRRVEDAGKIDLEELYNSLDLEKLLKTYEKLYANYVDFLEENGLEHCLKSAEPQKVALEAA